MSTPRRRRWMDVLRRTAGVGGDGRGATTDDAALWAAHEQAEKSLEESSARAERLGASTARGVEAFERLGVVALNAGLEGARVPEAQGRALLLLSEEIR